MDKEKTQEPISIEEYLKKRRENKKGEESEENQKKTTHNDGSKMQLTSRNMTYIGKREESLPESRLVWMIADLCSMQLTNWKMQMLPSCCR